MRGESRTNLFLQVAGSLSGAGTIRLLGGSGGGGGNGGDGCSNPSYGAAYGGSPGGGGGGGAGGKLVVRAYSSGGFNFAKQTLLAGGKGGKQGSGAYRSNRLLVPAPTTVCPALVEALNSHT